MMRPQDMGPHDMPCEAVAASTAPGDWLDAWERGRPMDWIGRGLALLELAGTGMSAERCAALPIGERDRRLLRLRASMFGPNLVGLVECPECAERLEFEAMVDDLVFERPADCDALLTLQLDGLDVRLRLPDSRDLRAATVARDAARALIEGCIVSARRGDAAIEAATLPDDVLVHAADRIAEADPQADVRLALSCAACGAHCRAPFDIVSFAWAELEVRSEHLLWETHVLAQAYGWSERDVLALGPARREAYLRMVLA